MHAHGHARSHTRQYISRKHARVHACPRILCRQSLVVPFHAFEFNFTADECRRNAEMWSAKVDAKVAYLVGFEKGGMALQGTRLRIGYVSGSGKSSVRQDASRE
jgi:hypothetical protein